MAQNAGVPVFEGTGTTAMFATFNYLMAAHVDHDIGSCKTIAVFIEEHRPGCQQGHLTAS